MKSDVKKESNKAPESATGHNPEFNFDLWAKQVRPQLLAALQKRGGRY